MQNVVINYKPNEKQYIFHSCNADEVIYGGAKGGGKSYALVHDCLAYALENPGCYCYLFRESYDALESNLIDTWIMNVPRVLYTYTVNNHLVKMINGSKIYFRYIRNKDDARKYNGRSIDYIGVDELTFFDEEWIQVLLSCLRSPRGFKPVFKGTCNPGGRGHAWVKERYVNGTDYGEKEIIDKISHNKIAFIPATVRDNTVLMDNDPAYIRRLENLPEAQREAYLNGNWDIFEGQYFPEFDYKIHTIDPLKVIPEGWTKYVTLDYGLDMLAAYVVMIDEQEQAYVTKEIYKSGLKVSAAAQLIKGKFGDGIERYIAPPDLWNKHSDTGRSTAEIFYENGIILSKAQNDRVQGWNDLREWLNPYNDEHGVPRSRLQIYRTCKNLIRCLPQLQYDDKNPNDCAKEPHEITHAPDAIRYFVAGRPMTIHRSVSENVNLANFVDDDDISNFIDLGT